MCQHVFTKVRVQWWLSIIRVHIYRITKLCDSYHEILILFSFLFSFRRWKVEDKRIANCTLVPRVCLLLFVYLLLISLSRTSALSLSVAVNLLLFTLWTAIIPLMCIFVHFPSLELYLQTSSWWIWSYGGRAPQLQSPLVLWLPFWPCGLESLYPSPLLVPTLDSRNQWVNLLNYSYAIS